MTASLPLNKLPALPFPLISILQLQKWAAACGSHACTVDFNANSLAEITVDNQYKGNPSLQIYDEIRFKNCSLEYKVNGLWETALCSNQTKHISLHAYPQRNNFSSSRYRENKRLLRFLQSLWDSSLSSDNWQKFPTKDKTYRRIHLEEQ
jgi:hypothetical protein